MADNKEALLQRLQAEVDMLHREALETEQCLSVVIDEIRSGALPQGKAWKKAGIQFEAVDAIRASCEELCTALGGSGLPETFTAFTDEIERLGKLVSKKEYIEAKDFLLRLKAHDENVAKLFEEVKKDLRAIDIDALDYEECSEKMGKFVDLKNLFVSDPVSKVSYMQALGSAFDPAILALAFSGDYDLEDVVEEVPDIAPDAVPVPAEPVGEIEEEKPGSLLFDEFGVSIEELDEKLGFEFSDFDEYNIISEEAEAQSKKPFGVKKFKEMIRSESIPNRAAAKDALSLLGTVFTLARSEDESRSIFNAAMDFLYKKGYLRRLYVEEWEDCPVMVATDKARAMFASKSATDFIGCNTHKEFPTASTDPIDFFRVFLASGDACRIVRRAAAEGKDATRIRLSADKTTFPPKGHLFAYRIEAGPAVALHTGIVCEDLGDIEKFLCRTIRAMEGYDDIEELHVSAMTKEQADDLIEAIRILAEKKGLHVPKGIPHGALNDDEDDWDDDPGDEWDDSDDPEEAYEADDASEESDSLQEAASGSEPSLGKPSVTQEISSSLQEDVPTKKNPAVREKKTAVKQPLKKAEPKAGASGKSPSAAARKAVPAAGFAVENFINDGKLYCATAYAKAKGLKDPSAMPGYLRLAYAVDDPAEQCAYTSDKLFDVYGDFESEADYYYQTAAVLRLFFAGQSRYEYNLQAIHDSISGSPAINGNAELNDLIYRLRLFRQNNGVSADRYADYRSHDRVELEKQLAKIRTDAAAYYDNDFIKQRMMKTKTINRRYEATWREIFSRDSDFATYLNAAAENDTEFLGLAKTFMEEAFIKDGLSVAPENIDIRKVDDLMDRIWDSVDISDKVALVMKSTNLMGAMRNNFRQHITKSASAIASWVEIHEALGDSTDEGYAAYAAIKGKLLELSDKALEEIGKKKEDAAGSVLAGLSILGMTVAEIRSKLDGSFDASKHRYFYTDFLKDNYVMLGDDYLPDFNCTIPQVEGMEMTRLIEKHAKNAEGTLEENLSDYCGDNFRSARLIGELIAMKTGEDPEIMGTLSEAEKYAEGQIEFAYRDFVSDLELAQSYGQLDADESEGKKDAILLLVNTWYDWAKETHNFGFYKTLLAELRLKIRNDAEGRGKTLEKQLASHLESDPSYERDHADYVDRIRKMIGKQNFLVAEDMINHLLADDIPKDTELFETDYLAEFQKGYEYYYKLSGKSGQALTSLVRANDLKALSNKDKKGALALKESWPSPGRAPKTEELRTILKTLGMDADKVVLADPVNNVFNVRTKMPVHENEYSYGHPIYAFGSVAARSGFRVIWLSGSYTADALIAKSRELAKGKHTLAFLDASLTESERRRLARKIKEDGSSTTFAVIDRVVYMYLLHNYSETYIGRMLMETIMPYAYYQPYIYDSASVMPPEMFIGRKAELEKIKDPAGVNIVYGGRQLGKSALLRKAKADVDGEEDRNRAVLVDIKDLDYRKAAKKISQALLDEHIIDKPIKDEEDWDEIARTIKNVLNGSRMVGYFLLMLDEADRMIESCEEVGYAPFNALKDIQQSVEPGRFKFVVAGLRNVVRFTKAATAGNSVLPHLESLTVKPFSAQEARMLLEQPLYYLGFRFPEENADLVPMILATANYFPGLIQLYCAKLIEALKKNYGDYDEASTPPYIMEEGLIKKVLAESGFRRQIREKFMITLTVGDDDYYYILALILAYLYRTEGRDDGYTASEILAVAREFATKRISGMTVEQVEALMTELCELNVMKVSGGRYLFSRYNFFSMMGSAEEVDDRLLEYSE